MPTSTHKSSDKSSLKEATIAKAVARKKSASGKSRGSTPKVAPFTLDDVQDFLASKKDAPAPTEAKISRKAPPKKVASKPQADPPQESQNRGAASLVEILGYDPLKGGKEEAEKSKVPAKFKAYYQLLVQLRRQLREEIDPHSGESSKSSGDDRLADEGTEAFDRDFILSLVSEDQDALAEIEEAIQRIFDGTYGVCQVTGKRISKGRLLALPFTRYSLKGKQELEKNKRRTLQRGAIFGSALEDSSQYFGDDSEE